MDTLGNLLALVLTAADEQDRAQVERLAAEVQGATGQTVEVAFLDQDYTGEAAAQAANALCLQLVVVKMLKAKRGLVLLPRRWVVERTYAWAARFRRLARHYERIPATLAGMHYLVSAILMLKRMVVAKAHVQ